MKRYINFYMSKLIDKEAKRLAKIDKKTKRERFLAYGKKECYRNHLAVILTHFEFFTENGTNCEFDQYNDFYYGEEGKAKDKALFDSMKKLYIKFFILAERKSEQ